MAVMYVRRFVLKLRPGGFVSVVQTTQILPLDRPFTGLSGLHLTFKVTLSLQCLCHEVAANGVCPTNVRGNESSRDHNPFAC